MNMHLEIDGGTIQEAFLRSRNGGLMVGVNRYEGIRVVITGVTSIHGWPIFLQLQHILGPENLCAIRSPKASLPAGKNVAGLCITDEKAFTRIRDTFAPTHIIHCAGVCDLDLCEERPHWARSMNVEGTAVIASVFGNSAHISFTSTDLVFSGIKAPGNGYTENTTPDPINVVGRTFAESESIISNLEAASVIRLGLPLGTSITRSKGAFDWVGSRLEKGLPVTLFHDEFRSGIACQQIAEIIPRMAFSNVCGCFNLGGDAPMSLYEIGLRVCEQRGYDTSMLKGIYRHEERNGPPRVGNVALDSTKIKSLLNIPAITG